METKPLQDSEGRLRIGKITNHMETATGKSGFELRNERDDNLIGWATSRKYKIMNTMFQKKAGKSWTWKRPNGVTKTEIDYIITNRTYIITDVTFNNQVNIGSDNIMIMSNIKLDVDVERQNDNQKASNCGCHTNRITENRVPSRIEKLIRDTTRTR